MRKPHYVIIGAGISGLALGWYLKERFKDQIALSIVEKGSRTGGWIRTQLIQGFLFEQGPRSCRTKGAGTATLDLVESLDLQNQVIAASSDALKRFLYVNGKLEALPQGVVSFLFSKLMRGVLPALVKEMWRSPGISSDESIYDFISRRLTPSIANTFIDPLTLGIYAGDIRQLSIRSCFPALYQLEQTHGSLMKGLLWKRKKQELPPLSPFVQTMQSTPIISFKEGMETLTKTLTKQLSETIHVEMYVTHLKPVGKLMKVIVEDSSSLMADRVFIATPAKTALSLLTPLLSSDEIALPEIPATSVVVVNMGWRSNVLNHKGFGHLIPSGEKKKILGIVWDSSVFPQQNTSRQETRLSVMMGGMHHPDAVKWSDERLVREAKLAVAEQLNIRSAPDVVHVQIAKEAISQYRVGHQAKVEFLEEQLSKKFPTLKLLGSAWYGAAVNDCIAHAKTIVQNL